MLMTLVMLMLFLILVCQQNNTCLLCSQRKEMYSLLKVSSSVADQLTTLKCHAKTR